MFEVKNVCIFNDINKVPCQYPWLSYDEECEVVIIGSGLSGCYTAYKLALAGINTILISKKPIAFSSSMISSYVFSFQNDIMISKLSKTIGTEKALNFFNLCNLKLLELEELSKELMDFSFVKRDGFLYTDKKESINDIHTEYLMRKHNGFDVEFLEKADVRDKLSFNIEAGLLSKDMSAEFNGYQLCHALLKKAERNNARIYENTEAINISEIDDTMIITTNHCKTIKAKKIVMATGYKQEEFFNDNVTRKTSFCIATSPLESLKGYDNSATIKNLDNNIHLRTTDDNRLIASGLDCSMLDKNSRITKLIKTDKLFEKKYIELYDHLEQMFRGVRELDVDYQYSGVYPETKDGLPIIGEKYGYNNIYFNMPNSLNGIASSAIGADIIVNLYQGNEVQNIFSPNRFLKSK